MFPTARCLERTRYNSQNLGSLMSLGYLEPSIHVCQQDELTKKCSELLNTLSEQATTLKNLGSLMFQSWGLSQRQTAFENISDGLYVCL